MRATAPAPACNSCTLAINGAIRDLKAAKRFVARGKFERAENALANSLSDIARAIRAINRFEKRKREKLR
ncbi:hypothetical protein [Paenibacillus alvei]|uniref:Uncharacterized protein n=1 Tax=Paenibacillus alvei TaxID=44250 RepID=A0A383R904_PAEAL|nr:hypothetical protein [Paenibacillus alvei]SYX83072.1 conserved protein of unknown function [Paenibacillus alvei]